jgi:hypothetical protein
MNPPEILIKVAFERTYPVVFCDFISDDDEAHMTLWLERRPELAELIARALELQREARAA